MENWILICVIVAVFIIVIVLIFGLKNLGPIIRNAINKYGPDITKTDVCIGDISVSLLSAQAELTDFYLGNPEGFKSPQAMNVESIQLDVDKSSMTGDTIIINNIEVVAPEITYERAGGTDNFKTILKNVKNDVISYDTDSKGPSNEKTGKKILIKNFIVRDGKVNIVIPFLDGKSLSAPLPDIHLKDLGKEKGGISPSEAFKEIFTALYEKITSPAITDILDKGLKSLTPLVGLINTLHI